MLQCRFEADEEIAAIANHFGCPVASQDSDFYIFDVAGGFIRLDSIAQAPSTTSIGGVEVKSLFCQLYHVRNLLTLFPGLDPQLLPLFPSVLGNDYVSRSTFDAFLSGLEPPEVCESKSNGGQQQTNIINLLHWIQTVTNREDAISQVLATVKPQDRDRKEKLLRASVSSYAAFTSGFVSSFERGSRLELLDSSGAPYPRWFAELFFSCEINSYLLNVAAARKVFHPPQIECSTMPSSYACSLPLRKVLFGLALGPEEGSDVTIEVFERDGEDLTRRLVRPSYQVPRFGKLSKIEDIPGLGVSKRRELFDRVLQFDGSNLEYPTSLHTFLAITAYWIKHTTAQINENLLRSLLLGVVLFRLRSRPCSLRNQVCHETKSETGNIQEVLPGVQDGDLTEVAVEEILKNFSKFFSRSVGGHARHFDADVVYAYCQLQTCMYSASCLLRTLLRPYQDVLFHESLNGTFLHNFTRELNAQRNPDLFISRNLVEGSPLEMAFCRFYKNFRRGLSDHYFGLKSRSTMKTSGVRTRMSDRGPASMLANRFADLAT